MTTSSPARRHYDSLDVLRGVAALSVVVNHLWLRYFPGQSTQAHALRLTANKPLSFWLTFPIQYGYFGVTLFFVLSGFCIHLPQAWRFKENGDNALPPLPFLEKRFRRLYPAYFASIVFTSVIMAALPMVLAASKGTLPDLVRVFGLWDVLYDVTLLMPLELTAPGFNGVYWTLIYEIQFYVAYPVLLYVTRRWGLRRVLVALFAVEMIFSFDLVPSSTSQYLFLRRWFEWYVGMYAAEAVVAGRAASGKWIATAGLSLGIVATLDPRLWPFRDLILSVGFVGLVLLCVSAERVANAASRTVWFCRSKAVLTLGLFSYSLYLIHVPVIDLVWNTGRLAVKYHVISPLMAKLVAPISIPAALLIGYGFFLAFERPFLRRKREHATPAVNQVECPRLRHAA